MRMEASMELRKPLNLKKGVWALSLTSVLIISIFSFLAWWIPTVGIGRIHSSLPLVLAIFVGTLSSITVLSFMLLVFGIVTGKYGPFTRALRCFVIKIMFPLSSLAGPFLGISKERAKQYFIEINNALVKGSRLSAKPEKLLILLPHCIQASDCKVKVTGNVENCRRCGKCEIDELVALAKSHNVFLSVATGGTLARKIIMEKRPEAVIAVACERDLSSGIVDSFPLPVLGVINDRPNGPCVNTFVDIPKVKEAMNFFLK